VITITIKTENAAFESTGEGVETARILRELADSIAKGSRPTKLRDSNGNVIGLIKYE
jgi:hypothetical protein